MSLTYTVVKASMIGFREGNDKLASTLVASVHPDASVHNPLRVHEGHQLVQKIRLSFEEVWRFLLDRRFKLFCVVTRDTIPRFGLAPVHCDC